MCAIEWKGVMATIVPKQTSLFTYSEK